MRVAAASLLFINWLGIVSTIEVDIDVFGDIHDSPTMPSSEIQSKIEAVDEELAAIDEMIQLQEKKLHHLTDIRRILQSETSTDNIADKLSNFIQKAVEQPVSSRDFQRIEQDLYRDHIVERAHVSIPNGIVAIDMLSIQQNLHFVFVADQDGIVHFISQTGNRIGSYNVGRSDLTGISIDSKSRVPRMYARFADNGFSIHVFAVWYKGRRIVGNTTTTPEEDAPEFSITMNADHSVKTSSKVTAIVAARSRGRAVLAVSLAEEKLQIYLHNTTLLRTYDLNSTANVMYSMGGVLAVGLQDRIQFFSAEREKFLSPQHTCHGIHRQRIVHITAESLSSHILFATTDVGDILVFNRRAKADRGTRCRLLYRFTASGHDRGQTVVTKALRGYLLSVSNKRFQVFNTTRLEQMNPMFLFDHPHAFKTDEYTQQMPLLAVSRAPREIQYSENTVVAYTPHRGHSKLIILEAMLPYYEPVYDITWIRLPLIVICVGGVLFWQYKNHQKRSTNPLPMGGGFEKLAELAKRAN